MTIKSEVFCTIVIELGRRNPLHSPLHIDCIFTMMLVAVPRIMLSTSQTDPDEYSRLSANTRQGQPDTARVLPELLPRISRAVAADEVEACDAAVAVVLDCRARRLEGLPDFLCE